MGKVGGVLAVITPTHCSKASEQQGEAAKPASPYRALGNNQLLEGARCKTVWCLGGLVGASLASVAAPA